MKLPQKPYADAPDVVVSGLQVDPAMGLSGEEVAKRLQFFGENRLQKQKHKPIIFIFFEQFLDPVIYILAIAAALGFLFGETVEGIAVVAVIFITAMIGFFMEWQARRSMEALKEISESKATVLREGKEVLIEDSNIVPGDILMLASGDFVPADARILEHESLAVKEAALTGESNQVEKIEEPLGEDTGLADRGNMVFHGTLISRGTGKAVVVCTGGQTELGKISRMTMEADDESTPIEKRLNQLSKKLIWLTLIVAALIALVGYLQGRELRQMIETAFALAVAAIPEGLPIVATIALARGMLRLAKDRAIIKKLSSVETLGNVGVICTDKTGTLTENQMATDTIVFAHKTVDVSSRGHAQSWKEEREDDAFTRLVETGALCNNATFNDDQTEVKGDPVEVAMVELAQMAGFDVEKIRKIHPEVVEWPFDTEIKMMATLNRYDSKYRISAKGALENILECCDSIFVEGKEEPLTEKDRWLKTADELASKGLRTLAFAYRNVDVALEKTHLLENLVFIGLVGFLDPPRTDVKAAIETCQKAGIKVVMVTGDHPETARNIAEAVGLLPEGSKEGIVTGKYLSTLNNLTPEEEKTLLISSVYARVDPSQKLKLVSFFQKHNYVVGMTGDGVNDAPALKKADIGIAMGIRGTEAAKEVADVILRDDQFSSIEFAIRQGRIIFENIRKFVVYLLSSNLAEIISVALASLSNLPLPLLPLQILYLNLVTDVFPALSLAMGEGEEGIMEEKPRKLSEPIMTRAHWVSTLIYGLGVTSGVLGISVLAYYYLKATPAEVNNMAFYTLVLAQLLNVFNLPKRSASFFKNEVTTNPWIWGSIVLCILLTGLGYFIEPLRNALSLVPLTLEQLLWVVAFSFASLFVTQIVKRLGGTI